MYFGIITASIEESSTSHLPPSSPYFISLHPEFNFPSTPCISLSLSLLLSLGYPFFSVSLFHHLFPSLCRHLSLLHPWIPLSSLNLIFLTLLDPFSSFFIYFVTLSITLSLLALYTFQNYWLFPCVVVVM